MPRLKNSSLSIKLTMTLLTLTLLSVALSGGLAIYLLKGEFTAYIRNNHMMRFTNTSESIGKIYASTGKWDEVKKELSQLNIGMGARVDVLDKGGKSVASTSQQCGMGEGMGGSTFGLSPMRLPIKANGRKVGTLVAYIGGRAGMLTSQDITFRSAIARSVLWGGLVSGLLAALVGIWLSRRLALPIYSVTHAITRLTEGNLEQYVPVDSNDEPGRLAIAFNTMVDRLKEQSYLRRKLTTDVSHELRTPLAAIQAHIEAFQDGVMKPDNENLESVLEEVRRLEQLISDLRDLSVAESGRSELRLERFDLSEVVKGICAAMFPLFKEKGINYVTQIPAQPIFVTADRRAIEKILRNLLSNAERYTNSGGKVAAELITKDNKGLIIVSDTGIGISEEDLPYIFERFYRADASRTRETGGTGVGLTIARELALANGGDIKAKSQLGSGSQFVLTLPLCR